MNSSRLLYVAENIHRLNKADRIVGFFLYDKDKEMIARIDGVLLEEKTGLARYIVISQGGFLDIQGKKTLVPREAYEVIDLGEVKTAWSSQSLQGAPAPNDINNITRDEEERILSYFDLQPYWVVKPEENPETW